MDWEDQEETTAVTDLKAKAAREGMLELADASVLELLRKYNEGK